jgi:hypothetical protein
MIRHGQAIFEGNLWALKWKYPGIFENSEPSQEVITEVLRILEMWDAIEGSHEDLTPEDRARVETEADPFGDARFAGFDGNH